MKRIKALIKAFKQGQKYASLVDDPTDVQTRRDGLLVVREVLVR